MLISSTQQGFVSLCWISAAGDISRKETAWGAAYFFLIFLSFFTLLIKRTSTFEGFLCRFGGKSVDPTALSAAAAPWVHGEPCSGLWGLSQGVLSVTSCCPSFVHSVGRAKRCYFREVILALLIFGQAPSSLCSHVVLPNHHKAHCPCLAQHRGRSQMATAAQGALN